MKLVSLRIKASGAVTVGAVIGEAYLDLHAASGGELPATMIEFLEQGEAAMERARALSDHAHFLQFFRSPFRTDDLE